MKDMRPRLGRMPRSAPPVAVCLAAIALAMAVPARAAPVLYGGNLYYTGGDVIVDIIHSDTAYDEVLQLRSALEVLDIADASQVGSQWTLTAEQLASIGIGVGDELRFGIHVQNTGQDYVLGSGDRNADGLEHAYVRPTAGNVYYVGFEDLFGGGDCDYNDTIFRFTSGMTADANFVPHFAAPEPASVLLLLTGMGLLGLGYRRK